MLVLSYFNTRNLRNADIVYALCKCRDSGGFANVVSLLADRLKIRTNGITSELAAVNHSSLRSTLNCISNTGDTQNTILVLNIYRYACLGLIA
jgi:hypothetical protein